ncbi:MAG: hypothetical protein K0Q95_2240 [Bacteroidota bacterium]|jgi:hypothetical protein|nr:hypothetical protein [Bacteroidota bacterium]
MNKAVTGEIGQKYNSFGPAIVLMLAVLLSFSSCKNQKKITLNNGKCILDFKNARTLTTNLKSNELNFTWLKAKLNAEALIDSSSNSFTINLRIKKDSVIWMSISKLGIEGARVYITKDSVKFTNTLQNKYFKGDYAYISKLLNTELDFEMLQSLLVGNSVAFYDEDEKIKPGIDNCSYTLGTVRKFKMRRVERGKELKEPAQSIYLVPENFKIARVLFYEFNPDRSFDAHFGDFMKIEADGQLFPQKMNYNIKAEKNVNIDLIYTKVTLNEEQSFPFKIPDNYEQIIYKGKQ